MLPKMYSSQIPPSSIPTDEEELGQRLSSLPPSSPPRRGHAKERKDPSITPNRFNRFWTPRSNNSSANSTRRVLFDLGPATNACSPAQSSPLKPLTSAAGQENTPPSFTRELKRRKVSHATASARNHGTSDKGLFDVNIQPAGQYDSVLPPAEDAQDDLSALPSLKNARYSEDGHVDDTFFLTEHSDVSIPKPIQRYSLSSLHGSRLDWDIGAGRRQQMRPVSDWQNDTAAFYTKHADIHQTDRMESPGERCVPFCVEGNKYKSVIALGDEEGYVRLLETNFSISPYNSLQGVVGKFRAHTNAIIDLAWSGDGRRIATASGDQTGKVTDLEMETPMAILAQHSASLKQIRFQPGNDSVLATSGRDGSIQIWDLRCRSSQGPVKDVHVPPQDQLLPPYYGCSVCGVQEAHNRNLSLWGGPRRGTAEVSVTAIDFLPQGREHLLLTASNSDAAVKVWDIRSIRPSYSRGGANLPLSETAEPILHKGYRDFGVSSMALSADGSRLFTVCKDNTIFAYSTAHLILGHAPEMDTNTTRTHRSPKKIKAGLAPLYGYRHPGLNVGTFYIKLAIRPARNGKPELLAVGNSNGSPILIPTDERHHSYQPQRLDAEMERIKPQKLAKKGAADGADDFPIYHNATALVRGHEREVGAVTWTSEGNLVTVDDDSVVRCWREDAEKARDLRTGGEGEGRRWAAGWAEVWGDYDDEFY